MKGLRTPLLAFLLAAMVAPCARATLSGTVAVTPGANVTPAVTSDTPGTLLATISAPFTTSTGAAAGTIVSAVYQEAGGTLDFYYQVTQNATASGCGSAGLPPCDPLARLTGITFLNFTTAVGYRTDGSTVPGGVFVDGTVVPVEADRDASGRAVAFSFYPQDSAKIQPGSTSVVVVVSTSATAYSTGFLTVVGGDGTTVSSFGPTLATAPVRSGASSGGGR